MSLVVFRSHQPQPISQVPGWGITASLAAATLLAWSAPAHAAQLTWNISFFDEAGAAVGAGQFITESRPQKILVETPPRIDPYKAIWSPISVRNVLQDFTATVSGVNWVRQDDMWGDWAPTGGTSDDGKGTAPEEYGYAHWLDNQGGLMNRFGFPSPSPYMGGTGVTGEPQSGWLFRQGLIRDTLLKELRMNGSFFGKETTNTWQHIEVMNPRQPSTYNVTTRGTWTVKRQRSTPEPSGWGASLMVVGLWGWRRWSRRSSGVLGRV